MSTALKLPPRTADEPLPTWLPKLAGVFLLVGAVVVVYWPCRNGQIQWDDKAHLTTNKDLQTNHGLWRIWFERGATQQYYPLLHSAFWLENRLWGNPVEDDQKKEIATSPDTIEAPEKTWDEQTPPYHWTNIIQHAISACLLWLLLARLKIPGAYLAAMIFAIHPVNVESVAWITEQKNTLSMIFYLGTALCYVQFDEGRRDASPIAATFWYLGAILLFVMGLLTKTVIATLPAALLIVFWWQRGKLDKRWLWDAIFLLPFFLVGAGAGIFTAWWEYSPQGIGAQGPEWTLSVTQRCLLASRVVWFYLYKLLLPINLIFFYPRWQINPSDWTWWLYPIAAALFIGFLVAISRRWRAPLAAFLFFGGTLVPVLGFLNVYPFRFSYVADHFQYSAELGIIVLVAGSVATLLAKLKPQARIVGEVLVCLVLLTLGSLTFQQSKLFGGTAIHLYEETVRRNPDCWICGDNWGSKLMDQGDYSASIPHFERALELNPNYPEAIRDMSTAYLALGDTTIWIETLEKFVERHPEIAAAHAHLAQAYLAVQRYNPALEQFRLAAEKSPETTQHNYDYATMLMRMGKHKEALPYAKKAVSLGPQYYELHADLARALSQLDEPELARQATLEALRVAREQHRSRDVAEMERLLLKLRGSSSAQDSK